MGPIDGQDGGGRWIRGGGTDSDIVMSSRVRLARNMAGYPFIPRASDEQKGEIVDLVSACVLGSVLGENSEYLDMDGMTSVDLQYLIERHLVSRELATGEGRRGVAFDPAEIRAVMVAPAEGREAPPAPPAPPERVAPGCRCA